MKTVRSLHAPTAEVMGMQAHLLQAHIWTALVAFPALPPLMDRCLELAMGSSAGVSADNSADCKKGARRLENDILPQIAMTASLKLFLMER